MDRFGGFLLCRRLLLLLERLPPFLSPADISSWGWLAGWQSAGVRHSLCARKGWVPVRDGASSVGHQQTEPLSPWLCW